MPPQDIRCTALSSQSLQVSWQAPPASHANGVIKGYKLQYEPAEEWYGGYGLYPSIYQLKSMYDLFFIHLSMIANIDIILY